MADIILKVDSKHRISLTKLLKSKNVSSVSCSIMGDGHIILKPIASSPIIPNEETLQAIRETESGVGLVYFENDKDFYQDLDS
ncbi:unnamed protein product [marine sediment metagenome]|uniref:Uncharacterized protein n=1 Tax=marine sediment metagenome TaxID=412755 RepID=X1TWH0_9ZZZZ